MDLKLEVVVIPVSDVDRAKAFYEETLGFRVDADLRVSENYRLVQLTPPGSECSIHIGKGITQAVPGTYQGTYLVTKDLVATLAELGQRGVEVNGPFHLGAEGPVPGLEPNRLDYGSFASFQDPDGNSWLIQEVKKRAPGR